MPGLTKEAIPPTVRKAYGEAECLVSGPEVIFAIDQLAVRLTVDLAESNPIILCVMNGALVFAGTLLPRLQFPLQMDYVHVSRYRDSTSGQELRWHAKPELSLQGRTVLLLDEVLDQGITLAELRSWVADAGAENIYTAVLVDKQVPEVRPIEADYVALQCPDRYLMGWGMDYQGYWRNLNGIYALPSENA